MSYKPVRLFVTRHLRLPEMCKTTRFNKYNRSEDDLGMTPLPAGATWQLSVPRRGIPWLPAACRHSCRNTWVTYRLYANKAAADAYHQHTENKTFSSLLSRTCSSCKNICNTRGTTLLASRANPPPFRNSACDLVVLHLPAYVIVIITIAVIKVSRVFLL